MPTSFDDDTDELTLQLPSLGPRTPDITEVDRSFARSELQAAKRGDIIGGRYLVEGQIGRGGMGRVLQVRHSVLGKLFALKLPKRNRVDAPGLRERFHREAKVASSLAHDNICSVIDFGEDPDFGLFMVMELLDGVRLDYKIRRDGPLAPKVACDVIGQIAEALRYVHTRGIVHGDIKSENILLLRTPDRRRVAKLLDFGLARTAASGDPSQIEGTPEYLAPERITGAPASPRSDIYALGILFWESLVGRLPFSGMRQLVLQQQLEDALPPPSRFLERPLDERADLIVARATAKRAETRHPDVSSFLYELRTLSTMLGFEPSRRRVELVRQRGTRTADPSLDPAAGDVFEHAPVALASVDVHGRVRVANRAFLAFIGHHGDPTGLLLGETAFVDVYPALLDDLKLAATDRVTIKQVLHLRDVDGSLVDTAVILTPSPGERGAATGEVHLALHPLATRTEWSG
ncbi:MAG TPA: serine/threonine-protein kinase [Kofleriaceae bacterium]|nr:serine/threonine-protein kinase [Kofleriaceae bacterium]